MPYTPPAFNAVNADLFASTPITIPAFNAVNADLSSEDADVAPGDPSTNAKSRNFAILLAI